MAIEIEIAGELATAHGPFPIELLRLFSELRGKKTWNQSKSVEFPATKFNIGLIKRSEFEFPGAFVFKKNAAVDNSEFETLATQHATIHEPKTTYKPAMELFAHQKRAVSLSWERKAYALLLEMGLGKTAIMITNAGMLHLAKKLSGVLILSPKGVHRQWIEEQLPEHIDQSIKVNPIVWRKKAIPLKDMQRKGLTFLSMNVDAVRTPLGKKTAEQFLKAHSGRSMMIVDESHLIKTGSADRTKEAIALGRLATYRRISTGTPIAKNLIDAWSQFKFLDDSILGHPYMTSFRARYCVMGGWEGRQIVGTKNVEEFYSLIAPHSFRLTKDEALNLPEKMYVRREYEMGEKTAAHYNSLKRTFMTALDEGSIVDINSAATALLRLQQVVCGYLPIPDEEAEETRIEIFSDERIDIMLDIIEQVQGPVIIWARFIADINRISKRLNAEYGKQSAVTYFGSTSSKEREENKQAFLSGHSRFFISNPAAGGTGLNLQGDCQTAIYYSNSFDAIHRWQSEDRIHRMGTKGTCTYFDLIAAKSVDRAILTSLKNKKSLSSLSLDQIRQALLMT